jgi:ribA/ribD-fused uncharacterized protein
MTTQPERQDGDGLRECPFCKCTDVRLEENTIPREWRIRCERCACQTCWWHSEVDVRKAWNTRATPPQSRDAAEGAEEAFIWKCRHCDWSGSEPDSAPCNNHGHVYQAPLCPWCGRYFAEQDFPPAAPPKPAPDALRTALDSLIETAIHAEANSNASLGSNKQTWAAHARSIREAVAAISIAITAPELTSLQETQRTVPDAMREALEIARKVQRDAKLLSEGRTEADPDRLRWLHHSYGADEVASKIADAIDFSAPVPSPDDLRRSLDRAHDRLYGFQHDPVPSPDGAGEIVQDGFCSPGGRVSCLHLREQERCSDCPVNEEIDNNKRDRFEAARSLSPATGPAEPVAVWTVRRCVDSPSSAPTDQDYPAENYWDVLMPDGSWGGCVAVDANDARETMQKSWAEDHPVDAPPVRGDRDEMIRELINFVSSIRQRNINPETRNDLLNKIGSYSLPQSSAGEGGNHKLDNDRQVFFYEQDFYVLSNFSAFSLVWEGKRFDTSEAAYHWTKFMPNEIGIASMIREAPSAHEAFKLAERYKSVRRADWDEIKIIVMRDILRAKVDQHEYVRRKLLATGNRELIEDSWRDDFWGWGPNRDGQNTLGLLWMEVRDELRSRQPHPSSDGGGRG